MIRLKNLLNETGEGREDYPPYMFSPIGFSCAMCEYYYVKDKKHRCGNEEYIEYMGTDELIDPKTRKQIEDPTKWCSNWFEPAKAKDIPEKEK